MKTSQMIMLCVFLACAAAALYLRLASAPSPQVTQPVPAAPVPVAQSPIAPPPASTPPPPADTQANAAPADTGSDDNATAAVETAFILTIAKEFPVGASAQDLLAALQDHHYADTKAQPPGAACTHARQFAKSDAAGDRRSVGWCADSLGNITWIDFGGKAKAEAGMHVATGLGPPDAASPPPDNQPDAPPAPPPVATAAPPPPPLPPTVAPSPVPPAPPPAPAPAPDETSSSPSSSPSPPPSMPSVAGVMGGFTEPPGQGAAASHEVTLGAIHYKSATDWTIVLNGQLVGSRMRPKNITVTPTSVTLRVFSGTGYITVTLHPYSAYDLDTHTIVPLNKPK